MVSFKVHFKGKIHEIVTEPDTTVEIFKWLVYSVCDIPPPSQHYFELSDKEQSNDDLAVSSWPERVREKLTLEIVSVMGSGDEPVQWRECCSCVYFGDIPIKQPSFLSGTKKVCLGCATSCLSMTKTEPNPNQSTPFHCECSNAIPSGCLFASRVASSQSILPPGTTRNTLADEMSQEANLFAEKLRQRENDSRNVPANEVNAAREFANKLRGNLRIAVLWDDEGFQTKAREVVPIDLLISRAEKDEGMVNFHPKDALVKQLLSWFKHEFFVWVNAPDCESCGNLTQGIGHSAPSYEESMWLAGVVELYQCNECSHTTRFPRYNHPTKLLETRKGRCGEWANCFTGLCRALKFHAREAVDWTDHVWTECWEETSERMIHLDPCENAYDSPLMYEQGWGKKLSYVIAVSSEEIVDVSRRYTKEWNMSGMLARRKAMSEHSLNLVVDGLNQEQLRKLSSNRHDFLVKRQSIDKGHLAKLGNEVARELKHEETVGRISGSTEWKRARGEAGGVSSSVVSGGARINEYDWSCRRFSFVPVLDFNVFFAVVEQYCQNNLEWVLSSNEVQDLKNTIKAIKINPKTSVCKPHITIVRRALPKLSVWSVKEPFFDLLRLLLSSPEWSAEILRWQFTNTLNIMKKIECGEKFSGLIMACHCVSLILSQDGWAGVVKLPEIGGLVKIIQKAVNVSIENGASTNTLLLTTLNTMADLTEFLATHIALTDLIRATGNGYQRKYELVIPLHHMFDCIVKLLEHIKTYSDNSITPTVFLVKLVGMIGTLCSDAFHSDVRRARLPIARLLYRKELVQLLKELIEYDSKSGSRGFQLVQQNLRTTCHFVMGLIEQ